MTRRFCDGLAVVTFLLLGAQAALAFTDTASPRDHEIPLPEFAPVAPADVAAREASATAALAGTFGGRWHAYGYDAYTGASRWLYGSGPQTAPAITGAADLEGAARHVLRNLAGVLPLREGELRLAQTPHAGGKWSALFQQTHAGVDVWQAGATVVFDDQGRLMVVGSDFRDRIDVDPRPTLSADEAVSRARADLPFATYADADAQAPVLLVLPVPTSASEASYHLVWRVRIVSLDPLGAWVCHVDAHDGQTVWRYNDIYLEYQGTTSSDVSEDTYCLGHGPQAMPYLRVNVSGLGSVYADGAGNWSIAGSGAPRQVTADLYSPYVDLDNQAGGEAAYAGTAQAGVNLPVAFNDTNSRPDERDVFDAVNDIHDFFATFAPTFGYTNQQITAYVGRVDGFCPGNAWWNGTINFCEAAGQYANTGEIQGVVHHEFGHGVQDYILGFQGTTGMGEGNADILANLMTQESIIGPGFFVDQCSYGIRNSDNNLIYPDNVVGQEDHAAGQVIAGFNWDAMTLMQGVDGQAAGTLTAARNWHEGRVLLQPVDMPDQVFSAFVADDDDGNLDNGTPHHAYYCQAAQNHGFDCPAITVGVLLAHTPPSDTIDGGPYPLQVHVVSTEAALDPAQLDLVYRVGGGGWAVVPLSALGGDLYQGVVPPQTGGDVEYYFTAADVAGNAARLPALAPDFTFTFLVASAIDDIETAGGWTAGLAGDNATTGQWERVDPVGTIAQPENDHTGDAGVFCWVTGQQVAGQGDGYSDVDGGRTTLTSPTWDLTSYDQVQVRYWKWYSNDRGGAPNADWWDVSVSNDGGATWTALEHTMTSTAGWEAVTFDPVAIFGAAGQLRLRFVAADEADPSLIEAAIDDLAIIAVAAPTPVPGDDLAVHLAPVLGQNVPNPFNPLTEIQFAMARPGHAALRVYDLQGRLVRTLIEGDLAAGPQTVVWDGTGDDARPVSSGVYLYRLETVDRTLGKRMLLVK